jgi:lauroyl/myristoyl acyltransferase
MDKDDDIRRMTVSVLKIIEDAIMEQPEQWFWYNKRWVLDPIEETKEQK